MPESYTSEERQVWLVVDGDPDYLLLSDFEVTEGLSRLTSVKLSLFREKSKGRVDASTMVGKQFTVHLLHATTAGGDPGSVTGVMQLEGICCRFEALSEDFEFFGYAAEVVPKLWLAGQDAGCRAFLKQTVPDIIQKILHEWGIIHEVHRAGTYHVRDYTLQYCESDLDFILRRLEDDGISYYFDRGPGHKLHLVDSPIQFGPLTPVAALTWIELEQQGQENFAVWDWKRAVNVRPSRFRHEDFDFTRPQLDRLVGEQSDRKQGLRERTLYEYPGRFQNPGHGHRLAKIRLDEARGDLVVCEARSNVRTLVPGKVFTLLKHPAEAGKKFLVTAVVHNLHGGADYRSGGDPPGYVNWFTCVPVDSPYRPPRITPVPRIWGNQTALVTNGADGNPDNHGRIKVRYHWHDKLGHPIESDWIRVASPWAGMAWGAIHLPRVGHEVVVSFLDGDPEQPLIVGSVYNAKNTVPYALPANKTRAGFKSKSFGSAPGNEIVFEDKANDEFLLLHAEKDFLVTVQNDAKMTFRRDQLVEVMRHLHETVDGNRNQKVLGNSSVDVVGKHVDRAMERLIQASTIGVKGDMSVVLEAGATLSLKAGGGSITIDSSGVSINGPLVRLNSGGAPMAGPSGSPAAPEKPQPWVPKAGGGGEAPPPPPPAPPPGAEGPQLALPSVSKLFKKLKDAVTGGGKGKKKDDGGSTGLGLGVDEMLEKSPTLKKNVESLQASGWTIEYGEAGKGSYCDRTAKKIVVDESEKGKTTSVTQTLAHESGHAMYTPDAYTPPDGLDKDAYVAANVKKDLRDEGEATITNLQVRDEILAAGGPDIGVAGAKAKDYTEKYNACDDPTDPAKRDALRTDLGSIFRDGENPSTDPSKTYGEYYGGWYKDNYDKTHGTPAR